MKAWRTALILVMASIVLAACSSSRKGGYYEHDGPPDRQVDMSTIPDAVPHDEPLSETGNQPYVVFGKRYVPLKSAKGFHQKGIASWYGKQFHGKRTSSGEPYDMYAMTAAHTILPLPSYVRVKNLANGRSVVVRVNDRGPFKSDRIMDLSYAAATKLGMIGTGTALVEITAIGDNKPPSAVAVAPVPQPSSSRLYIQLGAFSNRDSAFRLRGQLVGDGFTNAEITEVMRGDLRLYRVRLGPLSSQQVANDLLATLRDAGYADARFVTE